MRLILLLLAALTLSPPNAWACSYAPGDGPQYDPETSFLNSDFVANVKLIKVYQPKDSLWTSGRAVVRKLNSYKGKLPLVFEITYHTGSSGCGFDYYTNTETIIFSYKNVSEPEKIDFRPLRGSDLKETKELLENLSHEQKGVPENEKVYVPDVTENIFVTPLHPSVLGRPKVDDFKSMSEEETLQIVSGIIRTCKNKAETEMTDEKITQKMRAIHLRPQIYIAYKNPVEWSIAGQKVEILSIWLPFYSRHIDAIEEKDKFFGPVVETSNGKALILESCKFPDVSEFFKPRASAQ